MFVLIVTFFNSRRDDTRLWNDCKQAFPPRFWFYYIFPKYFTSATFSWDFSNIFLCVVILSQILCNFRFQFVNKTKKYGDIIIFHSSVGRWGDHMLMYILLHLCFLVTIPRFHIRPNYFPGLWMVLLNHCLSNDFSDALTSSLLHNWATYSILPRPPLTRTVKQQNAVYVTPRALCIAGFLPVSNRF